MRTQQIPPDEAVDDLIARGAAARLSGSAIISAMGLGDVGYNQVILAGMKTAISLPDETFERAERAAKRLGITRSELYARAVDAFVESLDRTSVTSMLDAAIERTGHDDELTELVVSRSRAALESDGEEDW